MSTTAQPVELARARRFAGLAKLLALGALIGIAVLAYRRPEVRSALSREGVVAFVRGTGEWGPAVFVLLYALWVSLALPAIVVTGAASLLFPVFPAVASIVVGATLGAVIAFLTARFAGREFVARMLRGRVASWDEGLARNGFLFVLYSRLLYMPFTYYNFAAGLTKVSLRDFFWGTFLGVIPGTFIWVLFFGRLKELADRASQAAGVGAGIREALSLLVSSPRYLVPVMLLVASIVIPVAVKRTHSRISSRRESREKP
jgi:uncharacterized membrane protein YdjX (TVP38/TMEM64 family)